MRRTLFPSHDSAEPGLARRAARVYLIRHGEVDEAWRERIYGRLDVPLSRRGLEQAQRVAELLAGTPLQAVVSSGLARAEAAAACLRATRPTLARVDDPELIELDRGPWAGRSKSELRAADPEGLARWERSRGVLGPDGGETIEALAARALPALERHAAQHVGHALAIVAHLWICRAAVCHALGLPWTRAAQVAVPPGGFVVLDWPMPGVTVAARPELVALGPSAPLAAADN